MGSTSSRRCPEESAPRAVGRQSQNRTVERGRCGVGWKHEVSGAIRRRGLFLLGQLALLGALYVPDEAKVDRVDWYRIKTAFIGLKRLATLPEEDKQACIDARPEARSRAVDGSFE